MAKLIIFDLDGTLIDSIPDILYNINIYKSKLENYDVVDLIHNLVIENE